MIILASGSATRREMLTRSGVEFHVDAGAVDEEAVKAAMRQETGDAARVAEVLAEMKALQVSRRHCGMMVIGADQMLECEGRWFDKPTCRQDARSQLQALRGRRHTLISTAVAIRDGRRLWHHASKAHLTMRMFTMEFLDEYLDRVGEEILSSVGGYQMEGVGAQLFAKVEGDHFTILGLPLLPLLDFLRENGELRS